MPLRIRSSTALAGYPAIGLTAAALLLLTTARGLSQTLYDFGNPTAEEQQYIEHINRSRANPAAEGTRFATTTDPAVLSAYSYFSVDLAMMQSEFNAIAAQPPVAPNAKLMTTSRNHSAWMLATGTQAHDETNPTKTFSTRLSDAGYSYASAGENIYAFVSNVWQGHVGLDVDWGSGASGTTGGMQNPRGHRNNIHSSAIREIGVGVVFGTNTGPSGTVGPQLVTQDFGTQVSSPVFGTGVAYYDLNSNNAYDIGEGISGLTVNVSGASYYCNSASGGGWTVPIPTGAATRTVSFTGLNMNQAVNLTVPASANAKADLKLAYSPPSITSAASVPGNNPHTLTFTAVGGATGYTWTRSTTAAAAAENCENTTNVTVTKTGTYSTLNTAVKQQGTSSFHLENSTAASQSIQLNTLFYGNASASLGFQSRIRYATASEQFKVQVKEEGSTAWQDVFSQTGSGTSGEAAFNARNASLAGMSGKSFRVRFLLDYNSGSYYPSSGDTVGWFVDAITFTNVSQLSGTVTQSLASNSGSFTPVTGTTYLLAVAPVISGRDFPAAYQTLTATSASPVAPQITGQPASVTINSGSTASFTVTATGTSPSYQWYQGNSGVTTNPVAGATTSNFTTPALASTTSYWVRVSNNAGTVDSNTATATVLTPVAITQQPASVSIGSGSTATFNVTATGSSPSYQWYVGTTGTTTNPIAGATNSSYTTPSLTTTTSYWVRVSNGLGSVDSSTATATVVPAPTITAQPASVTIATGSTANFTVTATGTSLSYQWYQGNSGITTNPIAGATTSSYTTPALASTTSYWVRVSNSGGTVNSNTATATALTAIAITQQPVSASIGSGATTTFNVTATGSSPSYQWYVGNSGTTTNPIAGATTSSYTTPSLTTTTSYWVRVSNGLGSVNSNTATATVVQAPTITSQPASVTIATGSTATFTVVASGTGLSYQWYAGASGTISDPVAGATGSSFTTPALATTSNYWVKVSNIGGFANSATATATVTNPPVIQSQPVSTTITKGTTATISVTASGPSLNYQWYQGNSGTMGSPISGATTTTYTTPVINNGSKTYWVRVTNAAGLANSITSTISTQNGAVTRTFATWASEMETANSIAAGTLSNANGDYDKDGRRNLIEYTFGGSPLVPNDAAPRMPALQDTALQCVLQYQVDTSITDVTVTPVASIDFTSWYEPGAVGAPAGFADTLISTNGNIQTRKATLTKSANAKASLRIQVTRP